MDAALEASAEGIRAVKISLAGLGLTAVAQAVVVAADRLGRAARRHRAQLRRRADRGAAVDRVRPRPAAARPAATPTATGGPRTWPGSFIVAMIALSAVRRRLRVDPPAARPAAGRTPRRADRRRRWSGSPATSWSRRYRIRVGRRIGSAALVADGLHARTDGFTSLAVRARRARRAAPGFPLADPLVGLLITVAILVVLRRAAREVYRRLMDAVDPALVDAAETDAARHARASPTSTTCACAGSATAYGPRPSVVVDPALTVADAHAIAHDAHHRLLTRCPNCTAPRCTSALPSNLAPE